MRPVHVVLISSKEHKDVVKGYRVGADSHVTKPADSDRFPETMSDTWAEGL